MSRLLRKIIAWVALVAMAIFVVTLTIYLASPTILNDFYMMPLFFGLFGFFLFIIIKLDDKSKANDEKLKQLIESDMKSKTVEDDVVNDVVND